MLLRGLTFEGAWGDANGISFSSGNSLVVDHCDLQSFQNGAAILFAPSNAAKFQMIDSVLAFDGTSVMGAIEIAPLAGGSVKALIERVKILNPSGNAIRADGASGPGEIDVELRDVTAEGSTAASGIVAVSQTSGGPAVRIVADVVTSSHNLFGFRASGGTASIILSHSMIENNGAGVSVLNGGHVYSFGDNRFAGNGSDGAVTPIGLK